MEQDAWRIRYCWVKAHTGNEMADKLTKEAAMNTDIAICYNKIPKSVVKREIETTSVEKWQKVWNSTNKGDTTKEFFPSVTERLNINVSTNKHLTAIMTGHGNIKSCLHRFKIITSPT
jgi:transcription elongation factor GreA-like protein